MTEELQRKCRQGEFGHATPDGARVVITEAEATGDEARVEVEITETWGEGPFGEGPVPAGPSTYTFDEVLRMERHEDRWLIAQPPWPIHTCP